MNGPDYSSYTEEQLRHAYKSIDATRFPERTQELAARLHSLANQSTSPGAVSREFPTVSEDPAYLAIRRRVGGVLIAYSLLDMAITVFNFLKEGNFALQPNAGLFIIGILVMKGNLRSISLTRWFSVLLLPMGYMSVLVLPFIAPLDLTLTSMRLYPLPFFASLAMSALSCGLTYWLTRQMSRPPVLAALRHAGRKVWNLRIPALLGIAGALMVCISFSWLLSGASSEHAETLAREHTGPGYRYHTIGISYLSGNGKTTVFATVRAWNQKEIINLPVRWEK